MPDGPETSPETDSDELLREVAAAPDVDLPAELALTVLLEPGIVIDGKFRIEERLGAGGMGVVYAAHDLALGREVAIKFMRLERGVHDRLPEVIDREARATARLNHPNIVTLHEFGNWNGILYIVLERLRGETLSARLERGGMPLLDAFAIMEQIASALVHTHAAGVIHRDLKPQNVFLLADGGVKVLDFGVSGFGLASQPAPRVTEHDATAPRATLSRAGTPGYMAPEQWRGEPQDARTDLWAFGVMLFQLIAETLPYGLVAPSQQVDLAPVAARLPPEASDLVALLASCLAVSHDERASDAAQVAHLLQQIRRQLDPRLIPAVQPRSRASRLARGASVVIAGALALAIPLAVWSRKPAHSPCDGAEQELAGVWDPSTREQLRLRFANAGPHGPSTWTAVATTIDRYSHEWVAMHEQACRAGSGGAVTKCLAERRVQLLRVLREQDVRADTILSMLAAAQALAPISDCADPGYLASLATGASGSLRSDDGLLRAAVTVNGPGVEVVHAAVRAGDDFVIAGAAGVGATVAGNRIDGDGHFITRIARDGTLRWYEPARGMKPIALAPGTTDNLLVAGIYTSAATLAGKSLAAPRGGGDCFVASLDGATGRARWLVPCGASLDGEIRTLDVDRDGNLYVVGDFAGRARFGGEREIDADARPAMVPFAASWSDAGALRWITPGRGTGSARSKGIAVDGDAVIVGSRVTGGGWLGDRELRHGGCVVARLDRQTGAIRWLRELEIVKCELEAIAVHGQHVAAVGRHRGRGPWIEELSVDDGSDRWRARFGTHDQEGIRSATYTGAGTLTVLGYFGSSIAIGDQMLHGNGARDSFIASFDGTGRVIGALAFGGANDERSRWIGNGSTGTVLVAGRFDSSMIIGTHELRADGHSDGLLLELALPWLQR